MFITSTNPLFWFWAINPAIFAGDFADKNGGAYASSSSAKSSIVPPNLIDVAITSINLSTPSYPNACAPNIFPSTSYITFIVNGVASG